MLLLIDYAYLRVLPWNLGNRWIVTTTSLSTSKFIHLLFQTSSKESGKLRWWLWLLSRWSLLFNRIKQRIRLISWDKPVNTRLEVTSWLIQSISKNSILSILDYWGALPCHAFSTWWSIERLGCIFHIIFCLSIWNCIFLSLLIKLLPRDSFTFSFSFVLWVGAVIIIKNVALLNGHHLRFIWIWNHSQISIIIRVELIFFILIWDSICFVCLVIRSSFLTVVFFWLIHDIKLRWHLSSYMLLHQRILFLAPSKLTVELKCSKDQNINERTSNNW